MKALKLPFRLHQIRRNIVEGKDINLATLLIPYYEVHTDEKEKEDLRLKKI